MAPDVPSGTVTFLFTDIENSSAVAQKLPETWETLQARHRAVLESAIASHNGYVFHVVGDALCAAFDTVRDGLQAALEAQRALHAAAWNETPIFVRMGVHTGEAQAHHGDYQGYLTLTRAKRLMSAAHGGQILLSDASAGLARGVLARDMSLRDLGEHRLKSLLNPEHIWQLISPGLREDFPALETFTTVPNNLPVQLSSFLGREAEIADICALLQTHRLVTLTGSGGTGKTRLALQVAAEVLDRFKDGVWFIELAPLSDPELVPNTAASVLGVREVQGREVMTSLMDRLDGKDVLLILDNCEHLIESCASFADAVLRASRGSRLLASSHEALGVAGEAAYHVPSMECPDPGQAHRIPLEELTRYTAVRLFVERAGEAQATFRMTEANAAAIVQICHRLDGIPLAIELAAARAKVLHVQQIAERLDDRFRLLTRGSRSGLPRHQTLRSLIDWSHGLLSEPEQVLFRRLSVFAGGWTLEAAEQVCAGDGLQPDQVLDLLAHLVEKSLVGVDEGAEQSRYRMLETIRQYARDRLSEAGEQTRTRARHLDYMLALVEQAEAKMHGPEEVSWLDILELEGDNLSLAVEWALSLDDAQPALRLAGSAYWFWWTRAHWHEARRWLGEALARAGGELPTIARAKALNGLGWFSYVSGDFAEARAVLVEGAAIGRALADRLSLAESLTMLGLVGSLEASAGANQTLEEGLALSRELGYKVGIGRALRGFAQLKLSQGQHSEAQPLFEQSAAFLRETGDKDTLAFVVRRLGHGALRHGDFLKAYDLCAESLKLNLELGHKQGVAACLAALASVAARQGQPARAAQLYGATKALLESFEGQLHPVDVLENQPYMDDARSQPGEQQYAGAYAAGQALNMEQAAALALEQEGGKPSRTNSPV